MEPLVKIEKVNEFIAALEKTFKKDNFPWEWQVELPYPNNGEEVYTTYMGEKTRESSIRPKDRIDIRILITRYCLDDKDHINSVSLVVNGNYVYIDHQPGHNNSSPLKSFALKIREYCLKNKRAIVHQKISELTYYYK